MVYQERAEGQEKLYRGEGKEGRATRKFHIRKGREQSGAGRISGFRFQVAENR
jgi:hypothetical protein